MDYRFGQFRRSQFQNYLTPLSYTLDNLRVESSLSKGIYFIDKAVNLLDNNILQAQDGSGKQKSYYIRFKINKRNDSEQTINIRLVNTTKEKDNIQTVKTITVEKGSGSATFELILSPNDIHSYNEIYFELVRELIDYNIEIDKTTKGRILNITIERCDDICNIINILSSSIENQESLKKIGVQGPPGLLMVINGEEIRIGRSGIYEINRKVNISSIGFIVENNDKYFILDYQY